MQSMLRLSRALRLCQGSWHELKTTPGLPGLATRPPGARSIAALPCGEFDALYEELDAADALATPRFKAMLLDAAGTLIKPSEPAAKVYLRHAKPYGCQLTEREVLHRFRRAFSTIWGDDTPWGHSALRYIGDGREFWRYIIAESTGCSDERLCEGLYSYFARPEAWTVAPKAVSALGRLRDADVKLAVVSNFDTRLRPLLKAMQLDSLFDAIIVSAEIGAEKPNPVIFEAACTALGVSPNEAVHVGDDRRNDVFGARDAGCFAWMFGLDVVTMDEAADRVLFGHEDDDRLRAIAQ